MAVRRVLCKLSVLTIYVLFIFLILNTKSDKNLDIDVKSIFVNIYPSGCWISSSSAKLRQFSSKTESPSWKISMAINLAKISLSASYLVLLSGDVSLNPGPIKDQCVVCKKGCRINQRAVQCDECDLWYHAKCISMNCKEYEIVSHVKASWCCNACLFPGLDNSSLTEPNTDSYTSQRDNIEPNVRLLRGLKIAHLNVNRLVNKIDNIKEFISGHSFDILTLSETWLTPDISDDEIYIPGYSVARRDRRDSVKKCGGGTLVFVRDGIPFVVMSNPTPNPDFECIWLEIKRPYCKVLNLYCVYRPGDQSIDDFILNMDHCLENLDLDNTEVVWTGDFNVDYSKKSSLRKKLDEFALKNNLRQIVSKPTRVTENSSTLIDLIIVNNAHRIVQCDVLYSSISDHNPVFCVMKGGVKKLPGKVSEYRSFKNFDKDAFLRDLSNVPWNTIESVEDVDDALHLWERLFKDIADQHAPLKTKRSKANQTPWATSNLKELRRDRDYHRRKAQVNSNSSYHWQMYRKLRNYTNCEEKRLKSEYYCKLIEEASNNSSKMWKAIKETLPSKCQNDINAISVDGKLTTDPKGIAECLNLHFSNIGKKLARAFSSYRNYDQQSTLTNNFQFQPVTVNFVQEQLNQLKTNKAIGMDKISARLLRAGADIIATPLCYIINLSLQSGQFPKSWKFAKVTALFKQGDKTDKDNYRPISILPTVSKIIERAVHSQLYHYLTVNNLISPKQFGFRRGRSTALALSQFTDEVLGKMDDGVVNGIVFIDLKKAFDTVDHVILIQKLKNMGVRNIHLAWFNSYLSSRMQCTVVGQNSSSSRKVTVGVPQGSILGPLLFSIYVNELPNCLINTNVTLFADDTAIYCSSNSAPELQRLLNEDLHRLAKWLADHKLTLNVSKSKFMLVGGSKKLKSFTKVSLIINNERLDNVQSFKYLGVLINETMTWTDHVNYICKKAYKRIGILRRIKHLLPMATRELFVKTMILPLLDYGDIVWGDKHNDVLMQKIQVAQNAAAKVILDRTKLSSATQALKDLDWKTMSARRRIHRLIFTYKGLNRLMDWDFNFLSFRMTHNYNTRNKNNLCKPYSSKTYGKHRFICHCIDEWNSLDEQTRFLPFKLFKTAINNI